MVGWEIVVIAGIALTALVISLVVLFLRVKPSEIEDLQSQINDSNARDDEQDVRIDDVEDSVNSLDTDFADIGESIETLTTNVTTVQTDVTVLQTDITSLDADVTAVQDDVADVQATLADVQADVAQLQKDQVTSKQTMIRWLSPDSTTRTFPTPGPDPVVYQALDFDKLDPASIGTDITYAANKFQVKTHGTYLANTAVVLDGIPIAGSFSVWFTVEDAVGNVSPVVHDIHTHTENPANGPASTRVSTSAIVVLPAGGKIYVTVRQNPDTSTHSITGTLVDQVTRCELTLLHPA